MRLHLKINHGTNPDGINYQVTTKSIRARKWLAALRRNRQELWRGMVHVALAPQRDRPGYYPLIAVVLIYGFCFLLKSPLFERPVFAVFEMSGIPESGWAAYFLGTAAYSIVGLFMRGIPGLLIKKSGKLTTAAAHLLIALSLLYAYPLNPNWLCFGSWAAFALFLLYEECTPNEIIETTSPTSVLADNATRRTRSILD